MTQKYEHTFRIVKTLFLFNETSVQRGGYFLLFLLLHIMVSIPIRGETDGQDVK